MAPASVWGPKREGSMLRMGKDGREAGADSCRRADMDRKDATESQFTLLTSLHRISNSSLR